MTTSALAHSPKNDTRYDDLLAKARELGVAAGKGKDTMVQFGLLVLNAAYDGVMDLTKDKHSTGVDDAAHAYDTYNRAMAKATVFDHKTASGKVQAAKVRTCIKLGGWTRGGPGEPIATVNKLMAMREGLRKNPLTAKSLDDAYNTLLRFARYQLKANVVVDDELVLRAFCTKPATQQQTLEEYLKATTKRLDDLRAGRAAGNTLSHSSPAIVAALGALRQELTDLRSGKSKIAEKPEPEDE